jgi:hypothetical protein
MPIEGLAFYSLQSLGFTGGDPAKLSDAAAVVAFTFSVVLVDLVSEERDERRQVRLAQACQTIEFVFLDHKAP